MLLWLWDVNKDDDDVSDDEADFPDEGEESTSIERLVKLVKTSLTKNSLTPG